MPSPIGASDEAPGDADNDLYLPREPYWIATGLQIGIAQHVNVVVVALAHHALGIHCQPAALTEIEDVAVVSIAVQPRRQPVCPRQYILVNGNPCSVSPKGISTGTITAPSVAKTGEHQKAMGEWKCKVSIRSIQISISGIRTAEGRPRHSGHRATRKFFNAYGFE